MCRSHKFILNATMYAKRLFGLFEGVLLAWHWVLWYVLLEIKLESCNLDILHDISLPRAVFVSRKNETQTQSYQMAYRWV